MKKLTALLAASSLFISSASTASCTFANNEKESIEKSIDKMVEVASWAAKPSVLRTVNGVDPSYLLQKIDSMNARDLISGYGASNETMKDVFENLFKVNHPKKIDINFTKPEDSNTNLNFSSGDNPDPSNFSSLADTLSMILTILGAGNSFNSSLASQLSGLVNGLISSGSASTTLSNIASKLSKKFLEGMGSAFDFSTGIPSKATNGQAAKTMLGYLSVFFGKIGSDSEHTLTIPTIDWSTDLTNLSADNQFTLLHDFVFGLSNLINGSVKLDIQKLLDNIGYLFKALNIMGSIMGDIDYNLPVDQIKDSEHVFSNTKTNREYITAVMDQTFKPKNVALDTIGSTIRTWFSASKDDTHGYNFQKFLSTFFSSKDAAVADSGAAGIINAKEFLAIGFGDKTGNPGFIARLAEGTPFKSKSEGTDDDCYSPTLGTTFLVPLLWGVLHGVLKDKDTFVQVPVVKVGVYISNLIVNVVYVLLSDMTSGENIDNITSFLEDSTIQGLSPIIPKLLKVLNSNPDYTNQNSFQELYDGDLVAKIINALNPPSKLNNFTIATSDSGGGIYKLENIYNILTTNFSDVISDLSSVTKIKLPATLYFLNKKSLSQLAIDFGNYFAPEDNNNLKTGKTIFELDKIKQLFNSLSFDPKKVISYSQQAKIEKLEEKIPIEDNQSLLGYALDVMAATGVPGAGVPAAFELLGLNDNQSGYWTSSETDFPGTFFSNLNQLYDGGGFNKFILWIGAVINEVKKGIDNNSKNHFTYFLNSEYWKISDISHSNWNSLKGPVDISFKLSYTNPLTNNVFITDYVLQYTYGLFVFEKAVMENPPKS